jgi:hypothetical protein
MGDAHQGLRRPGEARAAWHRAAALYRAQHLDDAALEVEARLGSTGTARTPAVSRTSR